MQQSNPNEIHSSFISPDVCDTQSFNSVVGCEFTGASYLQSDPHPQATIERHLFSRCIAVSSLGCCEVVSYSRRQGDARQGIHQRSTSTSSLPHLTGTDHAPSSWIRSRGLAPPLVMPAGSFHPLLVQPITDGQGSRRPPVFSLDGSGPWTFQGRLWFHDGTRGPNYAINPRKLPRMRPPRDPTRNPGG